MGSVTVDEKGIEASNFGPRDKGTEKVAAALRRRLEKRTAPLFNGFQRQAIFVFVDAGPLVWPV